MWTLVVFFLLVITVLLVSAYPKKFLPCPMLAKGFVFDDGGDADGKPLVCLQGETGEAGTLNCGEFL